MGLYRNTLPHDIGPVDPGSPGGVRVIHAGITYEAEGEVEAQVRAMAGQVELSAAESEGSVPDPSSQPATGTVTTDQAVTDPAAAELDGLTVAKLKALAAARGVEVAHAGPRPRKSDYLEALS